MKKQTRTLSILVGVVVVAVAAVFAWVSFEPKQVAQTKVTFRLDSDFGSSLIRVAAADGTFTKYGIEAELEDYLDGPAAIQEMLDSPKSDIVLATTSGGAVSYFAPQKKGIKIVSQLANNEDNYYWVVKKDMGDGTVPGLKGLRLGYPDISGYRTFLQLSLEDHGLSNGEVTLVPMDVSEFASAMATGEIDAHPSRILLSELTFAALSGDAYELHDVGAYDWFSVLSTRTQTIEEHPQVLRAILEALLEAQSNSYRDLDGARAEVASSLMIPIQKVPEKVIDATSIRLSNGLLRELTINRRLLSIDLGMPESDFYEDPKEIIDSSLLLAISPEVVHLD